MTQILNSKVHLWVSIEEIDKNLYQLTLQKGRVTATAVINDVEAWQIHNQFDILVTSNSNDHGTEEKNS